MLTGWIEANFVINEPESARVRRVGPTRLALNGTALHESTFHTVNMLVAGRGDPEVRLGDINA